jgi:hypothetical protein
MLAKKLCADEISEFCSSLSPMPEHGNKSKESSVQKESLIRSK